MLNDYLQKAVRLQQRGKPFVLATVVRAERPTSAKPGAKAMITPDGVLTGWVGGSCAQPTIVREALRALQDGRPRLVRLCPPERLRQNHREGVVEVALTCISGGTLEVYIEPHLPEPHLVAIGHLPVTEALVTLGKALGYRVTVMCLEGSPARFSQADLVLDRIDFGQVDVGPQTYVVVASHGNYDEEALEAALKTDASYIALVSSSRRAEALLHYLRESGYPQETLAHVKYPAGLDFGAETPEEIALSILAEIVQIRRRPADLLHRPQDESPQAAAEAIDPVCGMAVDIATARYTSKLDGATFYFCCAGCKRTFDQQPKVYLDKE